MIFNLKTAKILLTGGYGFLGAKVYEQLIRVGAKPGNISRPRSKQLDLTILRNCKKAVNGKDLVIHLAAKVGGIGLNREKPGTLFYESAAMGIHLIEAARNAKVKKFVQVGTVCSYPKVPPHIPFREDDLWAGYPEETNAPYGLAKKMLLVQLQAYRQEFGFNGIYILPTNLYGPGDNFDPKSSHVIPALIKKFIDAIKYHQPQVVVWGTGRPTREFLYVDDAARGIVLAVLKYNKQEPINLGSSYEIRIKDLVKLIANLTGFTGKVVWDSSQPDGQPRRKLDTSRAKKEFGFEANMDFEAGLMNMIQSYKMLRD